MDPIAPMSIPSPIGLVNDLRSSVTGSVIDDPSAMGRFSRDQCGVAPAGVPAAVVKARSVADVVATVKIAGEYRSAVVTRGAGSGLSGGANAIDGCVVLAVEGMDAILEIDPANQRASVQAGVVNRDLDRAARSHGLFYAPDPGSRDICTIGGNIATNAGGMCCAKYGVTADHVLSLTAVLGDGSVASFRAPTRKDVVGLDLARTLVGSEGTLGVVVEATLRLLAVRRGLTTVAATFASSREAGDCVASFTRSGTAMALEFMDPATVRAVNAHTRMGLDDTGIILMAQFDGDDRRHVAARFGDEAERHGAEVFSTDDLEEGEAMMEARRAAYPALEALGTTLLDDVGVPVSRLSEMLGAIEAISLKTGLVIGTFGHAADGNLHPTVVFDASDEDEAMRARTAFEQIADAALDLGGTASGEHGVGSLKMRLASRQLGAVERALMQRVKAAFDPLGILNPGRGY